MRRNRRLGKEAMRITVIGAVTIIAAIIVAVLVLKALSDKSGQGPEKNDRQ